MATVDFGDTAVKGRIGAELAGRTDVPGIIVRRWLGCWIDFFGAGLGAFLGGLLLFTRTQSELMLALGALAGAAAYYIVLEARWGRTLGKLATGLKVVDAEGNTPGFKKALVRTLLRLVEVNPFLLGGIPAGVLAANDRHRQRLGDMAAQTYVVPVRDLRAAQLRDSVVVFD